MDCEPLNTKQPLKCECVAEFLLFSCKHLYIVHFWKRGKSVTQIQRLVQLLLLDKVMSHNQRHTGVQELHLMSKGPMQLIYN